MSSFVLALCTTVMLAAGNNAQVLNDMWMAQFKVDVAMAVHSIDRVVKADKKEAVPGVVCWGDSLTYGYAGNGTSYPGILTDLISAGGKDIDVVNLGSCSETSISIAARAGAYPLYLKDSTAIEFFEGTLNGVFMLADGEEVNISVLNDVGINPCTIGGVEGDLQAKHVDDKRVSYYRFEMADKTQPIDLNDGDLIVPYAANHYRDYTSVIFVGTNGGYNTDYGWDDLIYQQNRIILSRDKNQGNFLVIGMFWESLDYYEAMKAAYGDHFINFAEYCGGRAPTSFFASDEIHLNEMGYTALGYAVYDRMTKLGCLEQYE